MSVMDSADARERFAQRIQDEVGIKTHGLIHGLATVPREEFVGPGPWKIMRPASVATGYEVTPDSDPTQLYDNVLVALDAERKLNNGEPATLMRFLDSLDLAASDRFLHIGCGVGYYTAIASIAVRPGGKVTGVEIDGVLAKSAERNLSSYANVKVLCGDGNVESTELFDAILVNAGCTELQPSWLDQLAQGGRLLVPLTVALSSMPGIGGGFMLLVRRTSDGYDARFTSRVGIFHCVGSRTNHGEALLQRSLSKDNQYSVRRLRRDDHVQTDTCWLHGVSYCLSLM
jgi:protein-L-isoaspartate(D-aspartate) O-methyltransferase